MCALCEMLLTVRVYYSMVISLCVYTSYLLQGHSGTAGEYGQVFVSLALGSLKLEM